MIMRKRRVAVFCFIFVLLLCGGCSKRAAEQTNDLLHGEFLVVLNGTADKFCMLKPVGDEISEKLKKENGDVLPCTASLPEGAAFQPGDSIEADYRLSVPPEDRWKQALVYPVLELAEAELLFPADAGSLTEVWDFQYQYQLTNEARLQYEEDQKNSLLSETPIQIPADADWFEIAYYGEEEPLSYRFTESSDIEMIREALRNDSWQNRLESFPANMGTPSIYIYAEKEGLRYILNPYSDEDGALCFKVSVLEEERTLIRDYLAEGISYTDFIQTLDSLCPR